MPSNVKGRVKDNVHVKGVEDGYASSVAVCLIHRRRAFLSGAARALIAELTAWPTRR